MTMRFCNIETRVHGALKRIVRPENPLKVAKPDAIGQQPETLCELELGHVDVKSVGIALSPRHELPTKLHLLRKRRTVVVSPPRFEAATDTSMVALEHATLN
eukprot:Amastigsp_a341784_100.p3 type:complete len:102 gc:universal Amastigsp_a341784_100:488-183(-)